MNLHAFDILARRLTADLPRRSLILSALSVGVLRRAGIPGPAAAKKRRRKLRNKKVRLNDFGCVNVGGACRGNDANCCSGICEGKNAKKDKSRCVPHNVGICQPGQDDCAGVQVACGENAFCLRTTGDASFCGGLGKCFACTRDPDCEPLFGPGAACSVCADCESGTICNAAGA